MRPLNDSKKGQTIVLMTLFIGFLFGMSALAFDIGYAMMVRAKLVSAVDAATMAAIRFVPQGTGPMQVAATRTFNANLPAGLLLAKNPAIVTPQLTPVNGAIQVQVTGTADIPTFFARMFGKTALTVNATTTTSRRDRNVMLILDYSGSVTPVLSEIKTAANTFVNSFSEQYDNVGVSIFSRSGRLEYFPQKPFKTTLNTKINSISGSTWTNHAIGLYYAYQAMLDLNDPIKHLKNNEFVFFTDGRANYFPVQFNVVSWANCPGATISGSKRYVNGVYGDSSSTVWSMETRDPPYDPLSTPECNGWNRNWREGIRTTWYPPLTATGQALAPNGVSMGGFKLASPPALPGNSNRRKIAANVVDNLARIVRQDQRIKARIHTIGYQGDGTILSDVMERVANCDGCANVSAADANDNSQKKGRFVAANSADELLVAFLDVAGFIGRIIE